MQRILLKVGFPHSNAPHGHSADNSTDILPRDPIVAHDRFRDWIIQ